jgi:apolipoprotein N-acyltransferase
VTLRAAVAPVSEPAPRALAFGIVLPLLAGAACVTGFAPFYAWPVPIAAVAVLLLAWLRAQSRLQAFLSGLAFGLGYFLTGVSWVYVSLHTFGGMPAVLAAIATFLFCAYLAIFPAVAGAIAHRFAPQAGMARLASGAGALAAFEWLRGVLFTGFPWLNLGTSQAPASPLAGWAPVIGGYGVSLAVALSAALLVAALHRRASPRTRIASLCGLAAVAGSGALLATVDWTQPGGEPVEVSLLQGNVPQQIKWEEDVRARTLEAYRQMIFAARSPIVVIPETALPAFLDELPAEYVESLRTHAAATGKEILLGTVEREFRAPGREFRYFNSLVRVTGERQSYRKRHLVPFGEYIPPGFRWILAVLHIPMSDFDAGAAKQPPLAVKGIPLGVAICYEDIFGEEVIDALPEARVLVNVSNDAWFGESFAADQHLQSSQMRALETGRWMIRATNTGASAAIDPKGRVAKRLAAFVTGTLVATITPMQGMTPYARTGNAVALVLIVLTLAAAAWSGGGLRGRTR